MPRLFKRNVRITVHDQEFDSQFEGVRFPGRSHDGFRMRFRVEKSIHSKPNSAECLIENVSRDRRARLLAQDKPQFQIEAGYGDELARIFKGEAVEISPSRLEVGSTTTIKAKDGLKEPQARVSMALPPNVALEKVVEQIADKMKVSGANALKKIKEGKPVEGVKEFVRGLSLDGSAKDEMDKIAKSYGFRWSIQDGELQALFPDQVLDDKAVILAPSTGLVGSPVRVIDAKHPKAVIIRGASLLQSSITPGRQIILESAEMSGAFVCYRVLHEGDSHEGDFRTSFDAVPLGQKAPTERPKVKK